jgi:putative DNA primase/helicase
VFDQNSEPGKPGKPVHTIAADVGLGKTHAWLKRVELLVAAGKAPVLAVPRHRLGEEIVDKLARVGISAAVYSGRGAVDPDTPAKKMCRQIERVELITNALASVSTRACKDGDRICEHFATCGYQRQLEEHPDVWIIPHQLLFIGRPRFIPKPDVLAIDESFWSASLHGIDRPEIFLLRSLIEDRSIADDITSTADLIVISHEVHAALTREDAGRIRRTVLALTGLTPSDLDAARKLEWRRKIDIDDVYPGMPMATLRAICNRVAERNRGVARLARFWELLIRTITAPDERSPWLELCLDMLSSSTSGRAEPTIRMTWRDDIHPDWRAPAIIMDATMPIAIVRQFWPEAEEPCRISASMPHTRVQQIIDRPMTADMLIPTEGASEHTNATRRANVERVRRFIEVRADDVQPGRVLVICQKGLEDALVASELPSNVEVEHFNNVNGENTWSDVALVVVIGRTEPAPERVERVARALFATAIEEIAPDDKGAIRYPMVERGIRTREGSGVSAQGPRHPDPRAEAVRWAICEAGLVQAIGRGRGVNRSPADRLQIDILTNVVLPLEVDEVTTWERIQPSLAEVMRARGAVPTTYADMASAYPDLFRSADGARMALSRFPASANAAPDHEARLARCFMTPHV